MKKKIVVWGEDENDKKILVALELLAKENKVNITTFDESLATETFYNAMMDDWRAGKEVAFPEGFKQIEQPLSMTDDLLPENIKVQRSDVINRAKAEWHFVVLSSKLYDLYKSELEEFKDRVSNLVSFDGGLFEELKTFWSKVADQARERNIFRDHADKLKDQTNELFTKLKDLRSKANADLAKASKERYQVYATKLDELNAKVEKGLGLNPIFEELKRMQADFKKESFTRDDRNKLWNKIDASFKTLKEKKYGKKEGEQSNLSRLDRRYQGLMSAIDKMERSISRDKKDIEFQNKRVADTDGQLEMQIRQAKIIMIQERINSKQEKLNEMLATKVDLDKRKVKEEAKAAKLAEKAEVQKKAAELKQKVASEIAEKNSALETDADKLTKAAEAINKKPKKEAPKQEAPKQEAPKKESLLGAISTIASETMEDVVDTVKAVSSVVGDKVGDKVEEIKEKLDIDEKVESVKKAAAEMKEEVAEKVEEVKEAAAEFKEEATEKVEDVKSAIAEESKEGDSVKKAGFLSTIAAVGSKLAEEISEVAADVKEKAEDIVEEAKEAISGEEE